MSYVAMLRSRIEELLVLIDCDKLLLQYIELPDDSRLLGDFFKFLTVENDTTSISSYDTSNSDDSSISSYDSTNSSHVSNISSSDPVESAGKLYYKYYNLEREDYMVKAYKILKEIVDIQDVDIELVVQPENHVIWVKTDSPDMKHTRDRVNKILEPVGIVLEIYHFALRYSPSRSCTQLEMLPLYKLYDALYSLFLVIHLWVQWPNGLGICGVSRASITVRNRAYEPVIPSTPV
jgi:hypothetical protein